MRWLKLFLKALGFDVCAHDWTPWEDEYTTGFRLTNWGLFRNSYSEAPGFTHTHMRQKRTCHECNTLQVRHIHLKKTDITL